MSLVLVLLISTQLQYTDPAIDLYVEPDTILIPNTMVLLISTSMSLINSYVNFYHHVKIKANVVFNIAIDLDIDPHIDIQICQY